jgi:SEC-C motif-containing protein
MSLCPCGSNLDYITCCEQYLNNTAIPKTPEALMRSRYTAYTKAHIDYIKKTMDGKPLSGFNETEAAIWAKSVTWIGLKVIKSYLKSQDSHTGYVEFIASFSEHGHLKTLYETSQFELRDERWLYVDGLQNKTSSLKKDARNAPCPCGSLRKFKHCHGKS